jgi:hypothetical protein
VRILGLFFFAFSVFFCGYSGFPLFTYHSLFFAPSTNHFSRLTFHFSLPGARTLTMDSKMVSLAFL